MRYATREMNHNPLYKKITFFFLVVLVATPYVVFAQRASGIPFWGGPLISCTGDPVARDTSGNITGPREAANSSRTGACTSFCDLIDTGINIIYFIMTIALFAATPALFAWGGIMILTAGANPGNIETGKKILTGTLIGMVIILLSFVVIKTIVGFLSVKLPGINEPLLCERRTPPSP